jgi:cytochrome c5
MNRPAITIATLLGITLAAALSASLSGAQTPTTELPDGEGKKIIVRACTSCHDTAEITKFKGFYTKSEWRDVVTTMVMYGAELKEGEAEVLVEYLAKHFGK